MLTSSPRRSGYPCRPLIPRTTHPQSSPTRPFRLLASTWLARPIARAIPRHQTFPGKRSSLTCVREYICFDRLARAGYGKGTGVNVRIWATACMTWLAISKRVKSGTIYKSSLPRTRVSTQYKTSGGQQNLSTSMKGDPCDSPYCLSFVQKTKKHPTTIYIYYIIYSLNLASIIYR